MSQKYSLFAERVEQLQQRGVSRRNALLLVATKTAVHLEGEWLEAFWCSQCQETQWYHVRKCGQRTYQLSVAPRELWQQVEGVLHPQGNPSVGEFTRRHTRIVGYKVLKDFRAVG